MNAILKPLLNPAPQPDNVLQQLVDRWVDAKRAEAQARDARVGIEEAILEQLPRQDEGTQTVMLDDGRRLTITNKIDRKIDDAAWRAVMDKIPSELRPITHVLEPKLDLKGLRWCMEHRPDLYAVIATAITAKPAKPGVSLKAA